MAEFDVLSDMREVHVMYFVLLTISQISSKGAYTRYVHVHVHVYMWNRPLIHYVRVTLRE